MTLMEKRALRAARKQTRCWNTGIRPDAVLGVAIREILSANASDVSKVSKWFNGFSTLTGELDYRKIRG